MVCRHVSISARPRRPPYRFQGVSMTEDVRNRLDEELSWQDRTPVDAMVARAVTHGRHVRRVRRAGARAGTAAVVGLAVVAVTFGSQVGGTSPRQSASAGASAGASTPVAPSAAVTTVAAAHPTMTAKATPEKTAARAKPAPAAAPTSTTAAAPVVPRTLAPTPPGVPATTRGVLQLLSEQLGTLGTTGHAGVASDGTLDVELYLTTAKGTGMVRVSLDHSKTPGECPVADPAHDYYPVCSTDGAGDLVVKWSTPGNCIQNESVMVVHPDGAVVGFDLATCLAWDGQQNKPGPQPITAAQAAAFGADPRWDPSMSPQLVAAGASSFPTPFTFS
jgi:hypothetical protein